MDPFVVVPENPSSWTSRPSNCRRTPRTSPGRDAAKRRVVRRAEPRAAHRPGTPSSSWASIRSAAAAGRDGGRGGGGASIQQPYLRVVGLVEESGGARGGAPSPTQNRRSLRRCGSTVSRGHRDVRARIAPAIFGSDDIKAAVASLLFSGSRKTTTDGARLRGDVNVLPWRSVHRQVAVSQVRAPDGAHVRVHLRQGFLCRGSHRVRHQGR